MPHPLGAVRPPVRRPDDLAGGSAEELSDLALVALAREGRGGAAELLLARHAEVVRAAADEIGPGAYEASWAAMRARLDAPAPLDLPVRAAWLALLGSSTATDADAPVAGESWARVWTAFRDLPLAWQHAVWHARVEGEDAATLARALGITRYDASRAVVTATTALRRAVVRASTSGTEPACVELVSALVHDVPGALARDTRLALREHARACDDCLGLVRGVFTVELTLADVLVDAVLGGRAPAYLRTRDLSRTVERGLDTRRLSSVAVRGARPTAGVLVTAAAAVAVVSALVIRPPDVFSGGGGQESVESAAVRPGSLLQVGAPLDVVPTMLARPGALSGPGQGGAARGEGTGRSDGAGAGGTDASGGTDGGGDSSGSTDGATDPGAPDGPGTPTGPTPGEPGTPTDPGTPTPGTDGGGTDGGGTDGGGTPPPSIDLPVDVEVGGGGGVGVTIDPPIVGTGPIEVQLPPVPPLPDLPGGLLSDPQGPVSGLGGVLAHG